MKKPTKGDYAWLAVVCVLLVIVIINLPAEIERQKHLAQTEAPTAQPYTVISIKDIGTFDRSRLEFRIIAPGANSFEERALTVMKAAEDLRREKMVQVSRVFLEPNEKESGQGLALASALYAIDGQGFSGVEGKQWEVEATGEKPSQYIPKRIKYKDE